MGRRKAMARTQQRQQRIRKEQGLEARVTPERKRLIERTAMLRGRIVGCLKEYKERAGIHET